MSATKKTAALRWSFFLWLACAGASSGDRAPGVVSGVSMDGYPLSGICGANDSVQDALEVDPVPDIG